MTSEVYKIVNDIAPDYIKDLININKSTYNFRRENQASLPAVKSTIYGLSHSAMKLPEYGTVSLMTRGWLILPAVQETAPCMGWGHLRMSFMLNLGL